MTDAQEIVVGPQLGLRQRTQHWGRTATQLPIASSVCDISTGVALKED